MLLLKQTRLLLTLQTHFLKNMAINKFCLLHLYHYFHLDKKKFPGALTENIKKQMYSKDFLHLKITTGNTILRKEKAAKPQKTTY